MIECRSSPGFSSERCEPRSCRVPSSTSLLRSRARRRGPRRSSPPPAGQSARRRRRSPPRRPSSFASRSRGRTPTALDVRDRTAPALGRPPWRARCPGARAFRPPRRDARLRRAEGRGAPTFLGSRPRASATRARGPGIRARAAPAQRIAEVESRLEAEAAELGTTADHQRAAAIRLREELEHTAKDALAEALDELQSQAADRRRAIEDIADRLRQREQAMNEQIDPAERRSLSAGDRFRGARAATGRAARPRGVTRGRPVSEAGALEFENRMRAIREEAASRLQQELDRMSESFARRANCSSPTSSSRSPTTRRDGSSSGSTRRPGATRQRAPRAGTDSAAHKEPTTAGRERLSDSETHAHGRDDRDTPVERERAGKGGELASPHPPRGGLPGSPRRASRRK